MSNLQNAIAKALDFIQDKQDIPHDILIASIKHGEYKSSEGDLSKIIDVYYGKVEIALAGYFGGDSLVSSRNAFKRATTEAFVKAFDLGWLDGGRELPLDAEALAWYNARIEEEYNHINSLFQKAQEIRKDDDFDLNEWVQAKAESYSKTLTAIYNAARMLAEKNQLLTWRLGNTEVHCKTCLSLDGKSHRASWYIKRNYIPRQPGADMECGGYKCDCRLEDKEGNEVTI